MALIPAEAFRIGVFRIDAVSSNQVFANTPSNPAKPAAAISSIIRLQLGDEGTGTLDYAAFPPMASEDPRYVYRPGTHDAFRGRMRINEANEELWLVAAETVGEVNEGAITSWQDLERDLAGIDAATFVEEALGRIGTEELTPKVASLFHELAMSSSNYNAVKWGIAIGGLGADEEAWNDFLLLARHAEFTAWVCAAMITSAQLHDGEFDTLLDLLPLTDGWGLAHLVHVLFEHFAVSDDPTLLHDVVLYAMRNGGTARSVIATVITVSLRLDDLLDASHDDPELAPALFRLLVALAEVPGNNLVTLVTRSESSVEGYMSLLENAAPTVESLLALYVLDGTTDLGANVDGGGAPSSDVSTDPFGAVGNTRGAGAQSIAPHVVEAVRVMRERATPELVRAALADPSDRRMVFAIIRDLGMHEMLPDIVELCRRGTDAEAVTAFASIANESERMMLLEFLPNTEQLAERAAYGATHQTALEPEPAEDEGETDSGWPDETDADGYGEPALEEDSFSIDGHDVDRFSRTMFYSAVVHHLGPLGVDEARDAIVMAARDYHPQVRTAALVAMQHLPPSLIDQHCIDVLREALDGTEMSIWMTADETARRLHLENHLGLDDM